MVTKFSALTDQCFSLILDRVPLKDLMSRASLVSHHWRSMQLAACQRRRSLVLLFGMEPLDLYRESKFNSVFYDHGLDETGAELPSGSVEQSIELNRLDADYKFRLDEVKRLVNVLPNISSLTMVSDCVPSGTAINLLVRLLAAWRPNLTSLKIISQYMEGESSIDNSTNKQNVRQLFLQLGRLPALKHLTFEPHLTSPDYEIDDFAFVSRLEEFYFYWGVRKNAVFVEAWDNYIEPNRALRRIAFSSKYIHGRDDEFEEFLAKKSKQTGAFTRLPVGIPDSLSGLNRICCKFASLTTLSLGDWQEQSLAAMTRCLKPCTQLVRLYFALNYAIPMANKQIARIPSLKALDLVVKSEFHDSFHSWAPGLAHAFPNLLSIELIDDRNLCSDGCPHYGEKHVNKKADRIRKLKECADAWIETLRTSFSDGEKKLRTNYGLSSTSRLAK